MTKYINLKGRREKRFHHLELLITCYQRELKLLLNNHVYIDLVKGIFYYTYSSDDYKVFLSINIEFNT